MQKTQVLDFDRIRFFDLLFSGYLKFREVYLHYQQTGNPPHAGEIENLCLDYFSKLRDKAHSIFRRSPEDTAREGLRDYELLCEIVIGACYHEALQLQENLYLSSLYRFRYEHLREQVDHDDLDEYFKVGKEMIEEAEVQIPKNLEWTWKLLAEAVSLSKALLASLGRENRVVLKYATANLDLLEKVYEGPVLQDLFTDMFDGGVREALWNSARDYMDSGHHLPALDRISRMAVLAPTEKKEGEGPDREKVIETLRGIENEGKSIRDNDLVSRSQNLLAQFERAK